MDIQAQRTSASSVARRGGAPALRPPRGADCSVFSWSAAILVAVCWASGAVFAIYILGFFGGLALDGEGERWNEALPGLYDAGNPLATLAIGVHFLAGSVLLLLGPVQLIGRVRRASPRLHRGLGRLYIVSAAAAGAGGLVFILRNGTVGGPVMDVGFGLYGVLMVNSAHRAFVHARAGRYDLHRAWAIRLFALTVGSWLYRMEYGLWTLLFGDAGRAPEFRGWFDMAMVFAFYIPNLVLAQAFITLGREPRPAGANIVAAGVFLVATAFVGLVTVTFTVHLWAPRVLSSLL